MRKGVLAAAILVISAEATVPAGSAIDLAAATDSPSREADRLELGLEGVALADALAVAAPDDGIPRPRPKPRHVLPPSRVEQAKAQLARLRCDRHDAACLRFIGALPAKPLPPRNGEREARLAGQVVLRLNEYELERERRCLAIAGYAEARNEGSLGMAAVMWVVLNRIAQSSAPTTPCEVILAPGVLEAMNAPAYAKQRAEIARGLVPSHPVKPKVSRKDDDGPTIVEGRAYRRALLVAYNLLDGFLTTDPTDAATHYWSPTAQASLDREPPAWRRKFQHTVTFGSHEYFRPHRGLQQRMALD